MQIHHCVHNQAERELTRTLPRMAGESPTRLFNESRWLSKRGQNPWQT